MGPINARMLNYTSLKRLVGDKHSSLFGPFISYKENSVSNAAKFILKLVSNLAFDLIMNCSGAFAESKLHRPIFFQKNVVVNSMNLYLKEMLL
jgi:hypothetical protein